MTLKYFDLIRTLTSIDVTELVKEEGGVLVAISNRLSPSRIETSSPLEIAWTLLASHSSKVVLGICYRLPNSSDASITELHVSLQNIFSKFPKAPVLFLGDFNYPDLHPETGIAYHPLTLTCSPF